MIDRHSVLKRSSNTSYYFCSSCVYRLLTGYIQCEIILHIFSSCGSLRINVHRILQSGRGWGRQPGAFNLPSTPEAPPLLDPLFFRGGVQPVQMPGLYEWGGGDRVLQHVKHVPGGESVVVRK